VWRRSSGEEVQWVLILKADLEHYTRHACERSNCLSRRTEPLRGCRAELENAPLNMRISWRLLQVNTSYADFNTMRTSDRWNSESFLRRACDAMLDELDWDSLDSGRLHHSSSIARTLGGEVVIVAVVDDLSRMTTVLEDVAAERRHVGEPDAPLWLYLPRGLDLDAMQGAGLVARPVPVDPVTIHV
jgi:hypothetical protein